MWVVIRRACAAPKESTTEPAVEPDAEAEGALAEPEPNRGQLDRLEQGLGRILGMLEVHMGESAKTKAALGRGGAER